MHLLLQGCLTEGEEWLGRRKPCVSNKAERSRSTNRRSRIKGREEDGGRAGGLRVVVVGGGIVPKFEMPFVCGGWVGEPCV